LTSQIENCIGIYGIVRKI